MFETHSDQETFYTSLSKSATAAQGSTLLHQTSRVHALHFEAMFLCKFAPATSPGYSDSFITCRFTLLRADLQAVHITQHIRRVHKQQGNTIGTVVPSRLAPYRATAGAAGGTRAAGAHEYLPASQLSTARVLFEMTVKMLLYELICRNISQFAKRAIFCAESCCVRVCTRLSAAHKTNKSEESAMGHPVVAVLGATGAQGGGVVDALLKQGKWTVRAVTRSAAKAQALAKREHVEIMEADMGDKASLVKVHDITTTRVTVQMSLRLLAVVVLSLPAQTVSERTPSLQVIHCLQASQLCN